MRRRDTDRNTPKALHSEAQGRWYSGAPWVTSEEYVKVTLKALHQSRAAIVNRRNGHSGEPRPNLLIRTNEPDFVWTSPAHSPIMLAVGSANLSLLAVSFWSAASASFSRTSWRASIWAPFFAAPKVRFGLRLFPNCRRCTHGKEALLWQSEL